MALTNMTSKTLKEFFLWEYFVPDYQREYTWEQENLEDFWSDLLELNEDKSYDYHFFGMIVLHYNEDEKRKYIVDGQQRTSTATILLRAIEKHCELFDNDRSAKDIAGEIRMQQIGRYSDFKQDLRLHLGGTDREFFKNNIQLGVPCDDQKITIRSHKKIAAAYYFFYDKITDLILKISSADEKVRALNCLYENLINKFQVMYIETTKIDEAFVFFETLNARGKELETADLLKNHVMRHAINERDVIKQMWWEMADNLNGIDSTKYIRHFWNSRHEFVREKQLYRKLSKTYNTPKKCKELVVNLKQYSEYYTSLVKPSPDGAFDDLDIITLLQELKKMKASSFYPIILAMVEEEYGEGDIKGVLKTIAKLVFRNFTICGQTANKYEISFACIAYKIYNEEISGVDAVKNIVEDLIVSDNEFRAMFMEYSNKNKDMIRFILGKLNDSISKETTVRTNNNLVHIEHIMPINAEQWDVDEETHQENLWKLGNLTLLGQKCNEAAKNKVFKEKKVYYDQSDIKLTKELCRYQSWGKAEIENRQKLLATYAMNLWA